MRAGVRFLHYAPVALGLAALFLVGGCYAGSSASLAPPDSSVPPPTSTPNATASAPTESPHFCGTADLFVDYAPYTTATLAGYGWDFVVADVVSFEPAIFNTPDGGPPAGFPEAPSSPNPNPNAQTLIYTPVDVVIGDAISGSLSAGPSQFLIEGGTVPLKGGTIDCYTMYVDDAPRVDLGARYVFIISDAPDSNGEKLLPLAKARFAWPVDDKGTVITVDGPMSIDDLTRIVLAAAASMEPQGTPASK